MEPNSELGAAITYMEKRWTRLTRFLLIPAPAGGHQRGQVSLEAVHPAPHKESALQAGIH